jgi:excisionase family DNA binding protein
MAKDEDELLTIGPAAEYLGLSVGWVRLECERGRIPFTRAGLTRLFKVSDLAAVKLTRDRERAKGRK